MVDGGRCSIRPSITRTLGAVEQGEHLSVTTVAIRNLEECGVRKSGHKRQTDDLLVKPLHGVQVMDTQGDLTQALDDGVYVSWSAIRRHVGGV